MDEFEFKPLSDGLGFHKKKIDLKSSVDEVDLFQSEHPDLTVETKKPFASLEIKEPYLNLDFVPPSVARTSKPSRSQPRLSEVEQKAFEPMFKKLQPHPHKNRVNAPALENEVRFKPVRWYLTASFLDLMFVMALTMLALIVVLTVTSVDFMAVMFRSGPNLLTQLSLGALFVTIYFCYLVLTRMVYSKTLGEWALDMQLGTDEQASQATYGFRVMWRNLIQMFLGIIFVPAISLILRKDVLGKLSGLELHRKGQS